jgi:Protein of unknown function (DUF742)
MTGGIQGDPGPFLRPYAVSEGRTEPTGADLAIEDLVGVATDPPSWLSLEHRSIVLACREPLSVAELAAQVDLPLGVTRVLVGDLAAQGVVTVHPAPSHTGGPDLALLEQVLQGLQRL